MTFYRLAILLVAALSAAITETDPSRIGRVESGLLPGQYVKGTPVPRFTIAERLAYYNVPGVSVAVEGFQSRQTRDEVRAETITIHKRTFDLR